ncbi:hypothetical protein LZ554_004916 [Drepanopeziza brunnea f. sp. 'monogermtubi']|nr:hypothetical protein LZ554_004916 [Drepanopeziza brunnea f. sp. 'monogermtubi']
MQHFLVFGSFNLVLRQLPLSDHNRGIGIRDILTFVFFFFSLEEYVCQGNCTGPGVVAVIECLFFMLTYDPEDWMYCFSNVVGAAPSVSAAALSTQQATPSPAPARCKKQGQPPAPEVDRSVVEKVVDGVGDLVVAGVDLVCVLGKGIGKLFTCTVDAATRHPKCVKK